MSFYQTAVRLSSSAKSSQSKLWIARQSRDPYVQKRIRHPGPEAFRSRSSFKLLEILNNHEFIDKKDVNVVVDLGAAPGGWSQVLSNRFGWTGDFAEKKKGKGSEKGPKFSEDSDSLWSDTISPLVNEPKLENGGTNPTPEVFDPLNIDNIGLSPQPGQSGRGNIIAVDLNNIQPIPGVQTVMGDFLEEKTQQTILGLLFKANSKQPKVDVILSDMAANVTGNRVHDSQSSLEICEAVFEFATRNLRTADEVGRRRGGVLLMKFFYAPLLETFRDEKLVPNFYKTYCIKPPSSRPASSEAYFLCLGWKKKENLKPPRLPMDSTEDISASRVIY